MTGDATDGTPDANRGPGEVSGARLMVGSMVSHTIQFAVGRGVTWSEITAETGVQRADLIAGDPWLPASVVPRVWRLVEARCPGEAPALDLARLAPLDFFGAMFPNLRFADDLRATLAVAIRFRALLSDGLELELVERDDEAALHFAHPTDAIDGGHGAEAGLGIAWRLLREVMGLGADVRRVAFAHPAHGPAARYVDFFGVPVCFEQPRHGLFFDRAALDRPLDARDPALFGYVREHLALMRARLEAIGPADGLAAVRSAIAHNAERAEYSAAALARRLGMSLRSMQRLVSEHGTTVTALLDAARASNARGLLGDDRLSIDEVAEAVGYADRRSFSRAFKRWTGQTPASARRAS